MTPSRRPLLDAPAKAQLWGLVVSSALAFLVLRHTRYELSVVLVGAGLTWAAWEMLAGLKLAATRYAPLAALLSGLAIPWGGMALAWALIALRP